MTVRELAASLGFSVEGKLRRVKDGKFGIDGHYPVYIDDGGNEYLMGKDGVTGGCIVKKNGGVL